MAVQTAHGYQVAEVFDALKRHRKISDRRIAEIAGPAYSRSTVQARRTGETGIDGDDIGAFAYALDVDPIVFGMTPDDARQWVIENRPIYTPPEPGGVIYLDDERSGCTSRDLLALILPFPERRSAELADAA